MTERTNLNTEAVEMVTGGDGVGESIGGNSDNMSPGNSSQPGAFGIIKCPNCGEEDKLDYLSHTTEGNHFRCKTCQTEFTR